MRARAFSLFDIVPRGRIIVGMAKPHPHKKTLLLLDSNAIAHRAYHAIPDLSTSDGRPTGALFGLASMLIRSIEDLKPDYIIATRDRAEKTHRHEAYEDYKATRMKTDEPLVEQLKRMPEVFEAFGIPVMDKAGYEADDIIGTLAEEAKKRDDLFTVILTGDMDMLQLVDDGRVTVYRLLTGITNMKFYDEAAVLEKYGFGPEHVTDYKGMRGDPSDNIKGIKGIGEKTATELIQKFGSIESMYALLKKDPAALEKQGIKPRVVELLRTGEKDAEFSKELATIRRDAPVHFELPDHPWSMQDHGEGIVALCDALEFRSLKERVSAAMGKKRAHGEEAEPETAAEPEEEAVDQHMLTETSVALWLLHSDMSVPSLMEIQEYAQEKDLAKAQQVIFDELKKTGRLAEVFDAIERPLVPIAARMNADGVAIDVSHLKALSREYGKELKAIAARIYRHAGHEFNINSPKQLATVLYDELSITPAKQKRTATGARTTREEELSKLAPEHPIIGDVLAHRELQKLLSTYIDKIPGLVAKDGRLHAKFLQAGTTTGRMASQDPNLQNIPVKTEYGRRIREAFAAPSGKMLAAIDYSQIELRIAAGLSGDKRLTEAFKSGEDIHRAVAAGVFNVSPDQVDHEMRRRAKVINFGILYGMGVNALRAALGNVPREEAARFLEEYFKNFSGLKTYIDETKRSAAKLGYTETLFGRRRYFSGFKSTLPSLRAQAERMATNAPIQGTQADIIKLAMVRADALIEQRGWRNKAKLVLQVHDELVYELDADIGQDAALAIRDVMEQVVPPQELSGVPILAEVSLGKNWGYLERLKR